MTLRCRRNIPTTSSANILLRIKAFVRSLVSDLANNSNSCSLSITLDRYKNYCHDPSGFCSCSSDLPCSKEVIAVEKESHACRLDVLLRVLLVIQWLLQENKHGSKRDIYYMHPSGFKEQAVVDRAIHDICILLKCSRHHLNVVPVGKGLVMGWLKFIEAGREIYCIRNPHAAYPIPISVEDVEGIVSVAQYILVVEKETVFQRLANDKFCDKNHCIVITGRGYPDVPTRRFLRHLVKQLQLPVFGLVDSDPYGFDILTTYRFGSMLMAYDAKSMRVPEIRWLGVFPSEYEKYNLPDRCLLHLTPEDFISDRKKAQAMMLRCYLHREAPEWRNIHLLELDPFISKNNKQAEGMKRSRLSTTVLMQS